MNINLCKKEFFFDHTALCFEKVEGLDLKFSRKVGFQTDSPIVECLESFYNEPVSQFDLRRAYLQQEKSKKRVTLVCFDDKLYLLQCWVVFDAETQSYKVHGKGCVEVVVFNSSETFNYTVFNCKNGACFGQAFVKSIQSVHILPKRQTKRLTA